MIISLGYRIKSKIVTQFRQWATKHLNEYIRKDFTKELKQIENKNKEKNERGHA